MSYEPLPVDFLIQRGYCCGSKCQNCPYDPQYQRGNKKLQQRYSGDE